MLELKRELVTDGMRNDAGEPISSRIADRLGSLIHGDKAVRFAF